MNLAQLLKNVPRAPFHQRDAMNLGHFLNANTERIEYYPINEWNGDTYVILKWPHKVSGLVILP